MYGAILDRPKNTALGGGGGKNPKQQAPQSKYLIFYCKVLKGVVIKVYLIENARDQILDRFIKKIVQNY